MKVLLTTKFPHHIGGLNSHILSLKKKLEEKNEKVSLLLNDKLTLKDKLMGGLKRIDLLFLNRKLLSMKLQEKKYKQKYEKEIEKINYDIFHFHEVYSLYYSLKSKEDEKVRILTVHGPASKEESITSPENKKYINEIIKMEKISFNKADRIIAVDTGQKDILIKEYNIPENKIDVIFNSIDIDFFKPDRTIKVENFFLVPRRLVPKNGVEIAIKAMKYVNDNYKLYIAGEGPEENKLKELVKQEKLDKKIKFLGALNHEILKKYILKSSGLIIPSIPVNGVIEATSISALEGMACGKIVFASNIGGLAELINSQENGILFEAGDYKALSEYINKLVRDKLLIEKIETNARESIIKKYSPEIWIKKVLLTYSKAIKEKKSEKNNSSIWN